MLSRIKFEAVVFKERKHRRNLMFDLMKIILLSFWVGDFVFSYSWFLSKKLRVTDNTIFSIFHSIYSSLRTVQFAILLSYNSARFKSFKKDRGKKVLVYIFVRENSDIYRQKAGLNFLVLWN